MVDLALGTNRPLISLKNIDTAEPHLFDTAALRTALEKSIGTLGPNDTGAIVAAADNDGAHVAIEVSKASRYGLWVVDAVYQHDWNGDNSAAGSIMFRW